MKNIYWLLGLLLAICYSCSELDDFPSTPSSESSLLSTTRTAGDEKYDVVGYGYDVTGEYLHPLSVRNPVLNIAKYEQDYFERLQYGTSSFGYDRMYYGYSSSDYIKDITTETKATYTMNYGNEKDTVFFSNTIKNNAYLKTEYSYSDKYSFASLDVIRNLKYIHINDEVSRLSQYLSDSFKEDLERLSPDRVIERYGTHVLTDFIIGGRYKLLFRSVITNVKDASTKRKTVSSGFKSTLDGMGFTYDLESMDTVNESLVKENQYKELYVLFYGGSGSNLKYDLEKGMPTSVDIQSWEKSVSLGNACLNDINWKDTYPIYDFISDPLKKEQIKAAVKQYIASSQLKVLELLPLKTYYHSDFGYGPNHDTTSYPYNEDREDGWIYSRLEGFVLKNRLPGTIPLYQYYYPDGFDHCTTTESDIHLKYKGWVQNGLMGYVYEKPVDGTSILFEYYYDEKNDHYTSTFPNLPQLYPEYIRFIHTSGYIYNPD